MTRFPRFHHLALAALALAVLCMAAEAQRPGGGQGGQRGPGGGQGFQRGPGGGGPGGGGLTGLLRNDQVQKELDLTDEQNEQLREVGRKLMEGMRDQFSGLRELSDEERTAKMQELQAEIMKRTLEALQDVLTQPQMERLMQVYLQQQGTRALSNTQVINALGITPDQQAELRQIGEDIRAKSQEVFGGMQGMRDMEPAEREKKFAELRQKREELTKEAEEKVMAVLTEGQKKTLKEMMGEPFEMERPERGGFGGGGGQGGGPDQGGRGQGGRQRSGGGQRPGG